MTWKLYANKLVGYAGRTWNIALAPSQKEAAKTLDLYFFEGDPYPPSPTDSRELEELDITELNICWHDKLNSLIEEYLKNFSAPIYFGYYAPDAPDNEDNWVWPDFERFEYLYGFKHPVLWDESEED